MKKENSNWDTYDFQDWVVKHVNLILGGQQLHLFVKNNFGYYDLKFFGKTQEAENLKSVYQSDMVGMRNIVLDGELQWSR